MDKVDQICSSMNLLTIQELNKGITESKEVAEGEALIKNQVPVFL